MAKTPKRKAATPKALAAAKPLVAANASVASAGTWLCSPDDQPTAATKSILTYLQSGAMTAGQTNDHGGWYDMPSIEANACTGHSDLMCKLALGSLIPGCVITNDQTDSTIRFAAKKS